MSSEHETKEALADVQGEVEAINSLDLYHGDDEDDGDSLHTLGYNRFVGQRNQSPRKELDYLDLVHMGRCGNQWCEECKKITRMVNLHSAKHLSPGYQCDLPFCGELLGLMKDKLVLTPGPCLFTVKHIRESVAAITT
ncbi:uncharacterized protein [Branchiostoma lanceolatum]|uniref:uncharacterized protein n=1 Tax=Branchiostoma lanceolatum TaxID=7740 RepID=UPI00345242D9